MFLWSFMPVHVNQMKKLTHVIQGTISSWLHDSPDCTVPYSSAVIERSLKSELSGDMCVDDVLVDP